MVTVTVTVIAFACLSLETLAPEMQFLAFKLKTRKISLRNLISCLNTLIPHMKKLLLKKF